MLSDLENAAWVAALRVIPDLFHSGKHMRCTPRTCVIPWKIDFYMSVAENPPEEYFHHCDEYSRNRLMSFYFQVYKVLLHMEMQRVQIICTSRKRVFEELEKKYIICQLLWQKLRGSERGLILMIKNYIF